MNYPCHTSLSFKKYSMKGETSPPAWGLGEEVEYTLRLEIQAQFLHDGHGIVTSAPSRELLDPP